MSPANSVKPGAGSVKRDIVRTMKGRSIVRTPGTPVGKSIRVIHDDNDNENDDGVEVGLE